MMDFVIKNGHVIDPACNIDAVCDVGIEDDKSLGVVSSADAVNTLDASGCYVFPGLIDFHTHIFHGGTALGVYPDLLLSTGVTTAVDAGSSGVINFAAFYQSILSRSLIHTYAYLNVGSVGLPGGDFNEKLGSEIYNERGIKPLFEKYPDVIKGLKILVDRDFSGPNGLACLDNTIRLADKCSCHVVAHASNPPCTEEEICSLLRPGDVMCHCYHGKGDTIIDDNGHILNAVIEARHRGILFDCANGYTNYNHSVAEAALAQDFYPDLISTDMTSVVLNQNKYCASLPWIMSKYLMLGMNLHDIVRCTTQTPAQILGITDQRGTLRYGAFADITICKIINATAVFTDNIGASRNGDKLIVPVATILDGKLVYRYAGL